MYINHKYGTKYKGIRTEGKVIQKSISISIRMNMHIVAVTTCMHFMAPQTHVATGDHLHTSRRMSLWLAVLRWSISLLNSFSLCSKICSSESTEPDCLPTVSMNAVENTFRQELHLPTRTEAARRWLSQPQRSSSDNSRSTHVHVQILQHNIE